MTKMKLKVYVMKLSKTLYIKMKMEREELFFTKPY